MNEFKWIFERVFGHRHHFVRQHLCHAAFSGYPAITAVVSRCACGYEYRVLTEAGLQQLGWGYPVDELLGTVPTPERTPEEHAAIVGAPRKTLIYTQQGGHS